jgi:hypothetical protein
MLINDSDLHILSIACDELYDYGEIFTTAEEIEISTLRKRRRRRDFILIMIVMMMIGQQVITFPSGVRS